MKQHRDVYRKNFSLIIIFLVMISMTLIVALVVSYNLTSSYVDSEFASKKIDVLEETVKPYNDFFTTRIPQITSYQGYLNNASASNYADSVFVNYPFVRRVFFYDLAIGSKTKDDKDNKLTIHIDSVYQYHRHHKKTGVTGSLVNIKDDNEDFRNMANKLNGYIAYADTSRSPTQDEI